MENNIERGRRNYGCYRVIAISLFRYGFVAYWALLGLLLSISGIFPFETLKNLSFKRRVQALWLTNQGQQLGGHDQSWNRQASDTGGSGGSLKILTMGVWSHSARDLIVCTYIPMSTGRFCFASRFQVTDELLSLEVICRRGLADYCCHIFED